MKELIYHVSIILYIVILIVLIIILIMYGKKKKTSRYFKIVRNLEVAACIIALIVYLSLDFFSLGPLIYLIWSVLAWLFLIRLDHKNMLRSKEAERRE